MIKSQISFYKISYLCYFLGVLSDLREAMSLSHACLAVWFLSDADDDTKLGNIVLRKKTCNDIGQAESK